MVISNNGCWELDVGGFFYYVVCWCLQLVWLYCVFMFFLYGYVVWCISYDVVDGEWSAVFYCVGGWVLWVLC